MGQGAAEVSMAQWLWGSLSKLPRYAAALLPRHADDILPLTMQQAQQLHLRERTSAQRDVLDNLGGLVGNLPTIVAVNHTCNRCLPGAKCVLHT